MKISTVFTLLTATVAVTLAKSSLASAGEYDWVVTQDWSPAYEKKFSEFVSTMGSSNCGSLTACLKSPAANPYYHRKTPQGRPFPADCADLPYALRMYFAWMEGLTFDYVSQIAQADPARESNGDIRYTKFGNKPKAFRRFTKGKTYNAYQEYLTLRDAVSTAQYRMHYSFISDFYPSKIDRTSILPGTIVYDPAGHAGIVYRIENDGRIRLMDAHPDNSVTRVTYDEKFVRSRPAHGAGLRRWRTDLSEQPTAQLADFSTEQFNSGYTLANENVSYYDWVRARLGGGTITFKPVEEFRNQMLEICSAIQDRSRSVEAALQSGLQDKSHPTRLPANIYGTVGEWEQYSSPSRDARLKVSFNELRKSTERYITLYEQRSPRVDYTPKASRYSRSCAAGDGRCFLVSELQTAYAEIANKTECGVEYKKSDRSVQRLKYFDIQSRLFALSFDPYHCVELRWGASAPNEIASCPDDAFKKQWYSAEQNLRNQLERTYDLKMDLDVDQTGRTLGVRTAADVDVWGFLYRLHPENPENH